MNTQFPEVAISSLPLDKSEVEPQLPGMPVSGQPQHKATAKDKDLDHKHMKAKVFGQYKQTQEKLKQRDEELMAEEEIERRIRKIKANSDQRLASLEKDFIVEHKGEVLSKNVQMDRYQNVNKLYNNSNRIRKFQSKSSNNLYRQPFDKDPMSKTGKVAKVAHISTPDAVTAKTKGFRLSAGHGVIGELERGVGKAAKKDIKVRQLEIERQKKLNQELKAHQAEEFKERLKKEKQLLLKRQEVEQQTLQELRAAHRPRRNQHPESVKNAGPSGGIGFEVDQEVGDQALPGNPDPAESGAFPSSPRGTGASSGRLTVRQCAKLQSYVSSLEQITQELLNQLQLRKQRDQTALQILQETFEAEKTPSGGTGDRQSEQALLDALLADREVGELFQQLADSSTSKVLRLDRAVRKARNLSGASMETKRALVDRLSTHDSQTLTAAAFADLLLGLSDTSRQKHLPQRSAEDLERQRAIAELEIKVQAFSEELSAIRANLPGDAPVSAVEMVQKILGLKETQKQLVEEVSVFLRTASSDADRLLQAVSTAKDEQELARKAEAVGTQGRHKIDLAQNTHGQAFGALESVEVGMKDLVLYEINNEQELLEDTKGLERLAQQVQAKIAQVQYKQLDVIMKLMGEKDKEKKAALLIQKWFRGYKGRKLATAKKSSKEKLRQKACKIARRVRKRLILKAVLDLVDSMALHKVHIGLQLILGSSEREFTRSLQEQTLRTLPYLRQNLRNESEAIEMEFAAEEEGDQALPTDSVGPVRQPSILSDSGTQLQIESDYQHLYGQGRALYLAISLQRRFRAEHRKANPQLFWISPVAPVSRCVLCHIEPVQRIVLDNNHPLVCNSCFKELPPKRRLSKPLKWVRDAESRTELAATAAAIISKVRRSRDMESLWTAWDFKHTGNVEWADVELLVSRLKMLTQVEKQVFLKFLGTYRGNDGVAYREVPKLLSPE